MEQIVISDKTDGNIFEVLSEYRKLKNDFGDGSKWNSGICVRAEDRLTFLSRKIADFFCPENNEVSNE